MAHEDIRLAALRDLGQSVWLDFISRDLLQTGRLAELVEQGVAGMTTNPTIFDKAIEQGGSYDAQIDELAGRVSAGEIVDELIATDVRDAADLLRGTWERTAHGDGYVSIEVPPSYADDTRGSIAEARKLWDMVDRPNVMVKIPGTRAGLEAIRQSVAAGLNVNITLLFSKQSYERVLDAYMSGLEDRVARHEPIDDLRSVASFFVSRVDAKADGRIDELLATGPDEATVARLRDLRGTLGIANARLVYRRFAESLRTERWHRLAERGAHLQRVLWASTSTKDPDYSDVMYVDHLIGPHTINTMPLETLEAFVDHGSVRRTVDQGLDAARARFDEAPRLGVDIETIVRELQPEGVALFRQSFDALLASVDRKRSELLTGEEGRMSA